MAPSSSHAQVIRQTIVGKTMHEELSCGHVRVSKLDQWKPSRSRFCKECLTAARESNPTRKARYDSNRKYKDKLRQAGAETPGARLKRQYRESGLCFNCGKESVAGTGYNLCSRCRERYRKTRAAASCCRYEGCLELISQSCGHRQRYCDKHYQQVLLERRTDFAKRREAGVCVRCGSAQAISGHSMCEYCTEDQRRRSRQKRQLLKAKVVQHYGGKCACCGESHIDFLTIDHVYNDGKEHRRSFGSQNDAVYRDLARRWPDDVQVLCFNCNSAKEYFGICPHERQRLGLPEIDYSAKKRRNR